MERSPEKLRDDVETRPEKAPERDLCLDSLLTQIKGRHHADFDPVDDRFLIEGFNESIVGEDRTRGLILLACQMPGCMANNVVVERISGENGTFELVDASNLSDCITR